MLDKPKKQVQTLVLSSILAFISLIAIVFWTDPYEVGWFTKGFFYLSMFLFCLGSFTLLGLYFRQNFLNTLYVINLKHSIRQAILVSVLICVTFLLSSQGLAYWWVEASLILFLLFFEIFFNLKI